MITETTLLTAQDRRFLQTFLPDEEHAPWMSITDLHRMAVTAALQPLSWHGGIIHPEWYIASELAVYFPLPDGGRNFVVPDLLVAIAPNHPRTSFDIEAEGGFPRFVLEVVSEESRKRDTGATDGKVGLYGLLGALEYAIFDPEGVLTPALQGYRRTAAGGWAPWPAGPRGELHSAVLGLTLVADGALLRLEDAQGRRLLTAEEERARAEEERARADSAEAKIAQLQALLRQHGIVED